jgi:hypothetical protein
MCEYRWQRTLWCREQKLPMAKLFAAVPLNTKKVAQSVSNNSQKTSFAFAVMASEP